ncbi:capsid protein [Aeromonas veronii]|uniref:Capsid protein n=1 Tax=Aeromonas veronii TaxID=654 RepID=A0A3A9J4J2_AERVE|nr:GPO family capsid scaffolding protein [Aeromonas veronii]RKJ83786.1 capsid protein [Aeromonas veronii]RKJ84389.1 capsid protein [Aeromonas veronii]RKJ89947.1 capsid protein [Aeromonas veronii]RKJ92175.1 capsid protein [Aeromonas veronii]
MATPIDSSLRTGWVAVATEGESIDGREISADWINDMAQTYDPTFYCAQLWPKHMKWGDNMGHVQALKADTVDGKLTLFAVLSPNRDLIYQNQRGQMRFCSIEPMPNFAGKGKTYLFGIGVTDVPASTGTTMLKFSAKHDKPIIGHSMPLDLCDFSLPSDMPEAGDRVGLLHQIFNFLGGHGSTPAEAAPAPKDDTEMTKEQMDQLTGLFTSLGAKIETFSAKVDAMGKPAEAPIADPVVADPAPVTAPVVAPVSAITAEQFSAMEQTIKGFGDQVLALNQKIEAFSVEVPNQRPDGLGGNDTTVTIC